MRTRTRALWFLAAWLAFTPGCKDRGRTAQPAAGASTSGSVSAAEVCSVVAEVLGVKAGEISPETTLVELAVDDLDLVEIIMELEDKYGISISDEMIEREAGGAKIADLPKALKVANLVNLVSEAKKTNAAATRPSH